MKKGMWSSLLLLFMVRGLSHARVVADELASGVAAFQQRQWNKAMGAFLNVLTQEPQNASAHTYLELIAKEYRTQRNANVQEDRLAILTHTAQRLEDRWVDARAIETAILDTTEAEKRVRQERWQGWCEKAEVEMELGHLLPAYDLVLRTLAENLSDLRAQQLLSELQSRVHFLLEKGTLTAEERFALEGFHAYGRADYEAAATAWQKGETVVRQSRAPEEAARHLAALHFESYLKVALVYVEENRQTAHTQALFQKAADLYAKGQFSEALRTFRQVAILNPEVPQLGHYLARSEAAVDKNRARRLGEKKQKEIAHLFEKGRDALRHERYRDAERDFQQVLALDATHPEAQSYLSIVQTELRRRHDPRAAQQHYEAGLIAYASGKLEEALREWEIATRTNPSHQRALNALVKVQKELAFSHEVIP